MTWLASFQRWLAIWTGTVNEPGPQYGFWSGFGGDLALVGAVLSAPLVLLRKHNCHVRGCWRLGRHPVEGTLFTVCARHDPGGKPTHHHILALHRAHQAAEEAHGDHRRM